MRLNDSGTYTLPPPPIVVTLISVTIALCFIYWQYAIILAVMSLIIIVIIIRVRSPSIAPISREVSEKSSASTGYFADVISNLSAVKAFANERYESSSTRSESKTGATRRSKK